MKGVKIKTRYKLLIAGELVILVILLGILIYQKRTPPSNYVSPEPQNLDTINHPSLIQQSSYSAQLPSSAPKTASKAANTAAANTLPQAWGRSINVPILYYHYIGVNPNPADKARNSLSISPDKLDAEMNYLSTTGWHPIDLDTLYAALEGKTSLPSKPIVLTFDDGYIDFYLNAFPILKRYGFHAVSFIPTGLINTSYYMSWGQIQEINTSGLIEFEAHSVHHPNMAILSQSAVDFEVTQSKKTLEGEIGKRVNFFAYPYGASNDYVRGEVKRAGFVAAVGTWAGYTETEGTVYDWPRIRVPGGANLDQFIKIL